MLNHTLIKRSLAVGLTVAAAAFPAAAQAEHAVDSGGVQSAAQVPVTGSEEPGIDRLDHNVQQWFATHGHFVSAAAPSTPSTATPSDGFHWDDAGIGAAGMVVLVGAGALGTATTRRRRRPALS